MANPAFFKGMKALNASGRPKLQHSVLTPEGELERLILGYFTPAKVRKMLRGQSAKEQLGFYSTALPLLVAKPGGNNMSAEDIDNLYLKLMDAIERNAKAS